MQLTQLIATTETTEECIPAVSSKRDTEVTFTTEVQAHSRYQRK